MESNYHQEDSLNSSDQEVDQPEQDNSLGVGRSYDCVFCKRGFNTAQALGGHMNIHRKDRAKNKPVSINPSNQDEKYTVPRLYQQISSCSPHYVAPQEALQVNYRTYFPVSETSSQPFYPHHRTINDQLNHQHLNPFGDDWRKSFSFPFGSTLAEDIEKNRRVGGQEEELDLELRLGP